jgi:hypothetical protein
MSVTSNFNRVKPGEDAMRRQWQAGYLIAVSTMLHQHDCPVTAEDALRDSGITLADMKACKLDVFDTKVLRPIFAEMARKDRLTHPPRSQPGPTR